VRALSHEHSMQPFLLSINRWFGEQRCASRRRVDLW
jgi:hypothetical protein